MSHHTRACRRTGAVGRGLHYEARDVLSGPPARARRLQLERFAAVDRVRLDLYQRLVRARPWLVHRGQDDRRSAPARPAGGCHSLHSDLLLDAARESGGREIKKTSGVTDRSNNRTARFDNHRK
jgi:hypothetical protein